MYTTAAREQRIALRRSAQRIKEITTQLIYINSQIELISKLINT